MNNQLPWKVTILLQLKGRKPMSLKEIYTEINEHGREAFYIKSESYHSNGQWGERPDYTHVVRSTISSLKRQGFVKPLETGKRTGVYWITDSGLEELSRIEP